MDWPGLFQLTDVLDEHGSTITQVPLSPLSLSLLLLLGILRCCYNTCTSSWHLSVCRLGFLFVGGEMDESLLKKITKAEMKINWTANFSQILQPVPHAGTSEFEPQLVTHEKIWTSLENDQCSNTEHQNQTIHAYFMKSSNISNSNVYRASVCLSV